MTQSANARLKSPSEAAPEDSSLDLGPLSRMTGYAMRRALISIDEDFVATFAAIDLRPAQFSAMLVIHLNPGRKQSEIAAALGIQRTNFVGLLDELERRGLTRRDQSAADRRAHAVALTDKGQRLLQKAIAALNAREQQIRDALGAQNHDTLLNLLNTAGTLAL